jgi:homoserine dehydrogenase
MTTDWQECRPRPEVHVVAELVGGTTIARDDDFGRAQARQTGRHGEQGAALRARRGAFCRGQAIRRESLLRSQRLRRHSHHQIVARRFVGNRITALYGIVNGTCNYILTRMKLEGADFAACSPTRKKQGYAETPPDLDIDGHDAAAQNRHSGLARARLLGEPKRFTSKASATCRSWTLNSPAARLHDQAAGHRQTIAGRKGPESREIAASSSVYPTLVPNAHVLASVNHVFNAVFVRGDIVGDTLFYGRGAGKDATASAVLSDLADAALDLKFGTKHRVPPFVPHECAGAVAPIDEVVRSILSGSTWWTNPARWRKSRPFSAGQNRHFLGHPARRP